jgi:hypothetical protein
MSVRPNDIMFYGSASMPEADGVTVGGAPDATKFVTFSDIGAGATLDAVSESGSDTAVKLSVAARDSTGIIHTITGVTLNGTTPVVGLGSAVVLERLLYGVLTGGAIGPLVDPGGAAPVGRIALYAHTPVISGHTAQAGSADPTSTMPAMFHLQAGDGAGVSIGQIIRITSGAGANQLYRIVATTGYGTDVIATTSNALTTPDATSVYSVYNGVMFPPPRLAFTRLFATSAADIPGGSTRVFYEKVFVVNISAINSLVGVQVEIASETPSLPTGQTLDIAMTNALNDTGSVANRQTAPASGITAFTVQPGFVNVPSPGNLPAGGPPNLAGTQGVWLRLTMPAGSGSFEGQGLLRALGNTT